MAEELGEVPEGQEITQESTTEKPKQFTDLQEFQTEMARLKDEEEKDGKTVDFRDLNPSHLTEEDMQAHNNYLARNWNKEEFEYYQSGIINSFNQNSRDEVVRAKREFSTYLGNLWAIELANRQTVKLLEDFRTIELPRLRKEEEEGRKTYYFQSINDQDISVEDMSMYRAIKNSSWHHKDFVEYQNKITPDLKDKSRLNFSVWMNNVLLPEIKKAKRREQK